MPTIRDRVLSWLDLTPPPETPPDESRADSVIQSSAMGFGMAGKDRVDEVTPKSGLRWWSQAQLVHSYMRGGIARRLAIAPPMDAIRHGYTVTTDTEEEETVPRALHVRRAALQARQYARAFRGALVYVRVDGDQSAPLGDGPHEVRALHVIMPSEATPSALSRQADVDRPDWTAPEFWDLHPTRPGLTFSGERRVHASRVIVVPGLDVPLDVTPPDDGFQAAVLDVYWESLRNLEVVTSSTTSLMSERSVAVYEQDGNGAASGRDGVSWLDRLRALRRATSVLGAITLPPGWKVSRTDATITGWRDAKVSAYEDVASVEGIPPAVAIGTPPAGMTSDDQASRRTYHRLLDGQERPILEDVILRVHEIVHGLDESRRMIWPALEEPTAVERAQISATLAQRDAALYAAQIVERDEIRGRHLGDREIEYLQIDPTLDDAADAIEVDPGEDTAATLEEILRADAETYRPPESARNNARRVLKWREEHGDEVAGMTRVGWTRARQLAEGRPLSRETVGRMAAFERHRKNSEVAPEYKDTPWRDAGRVAWLGWGGDSGVAWAARIVARGDAEDKSTPAKPSERIKGSRTNPRGTASGSRGGIEVSEETEAALRSKVDEHNQDATEGRRVDLGMLKAVYRRGAGAFSTSHRPGMTRNQWSMGRVNAFLHLVRTGKPQDADYTGDNDLLPKDHPRSTREG